MIFSKQIPRILNKRVVYSNSDIFKLVVLKDESSDIFKKVLNEHLNELDSELYNFYLEKKNPQIIFSIKNIFLGITSGIHNPEEFRLFLESTIYNKERNIYYFNNSNNFVYFIPGETSYGEYLCGKIRKPIYIYGSHKIKDESEIDYIKNKDYSKINEISEIKIGKIFTDKLDILNYIFYPRNLCPDILTKIN